MPWFNPTLILIAIFAFVISGGLGYYSGHADGKESVQQAWDAERAEAAIAKAEFEKQAREKERQAQAVANRTRKLKDHEIREANARNTALLNSLRERPERPTNGGVSTDTGACVAATGAQLARGDGEFLARYAADAARLQAELNACAKQYDEVKKLLNKEDK